MINWQGFERKLLLLILSSQNLIGGFEGATEALAQGNRHQNRDGTWSLRNTNLDLCSLDHDARCLVTATHLCRSEAFQLLFYTMFDFTTFNSVEVVCGSTNRHPPLL